MQDKRVIIIAGGDFKDLDFYKKLFWQDDFIICVNGGTEHALRLEIKPSLVIGDLDSLTSLARDFIDRMNVQIEKHPSAKEKSDLELAVDYAVEINPKEIIILGALGGPRVDHAFINLLLLSIPLSLGITASLLNERQEIRLIDKQLIIAGERGDYVSLFALSTDAVGVKTDGLKFPLHGETLKFASTRGLSNEIVTTPAKITLKKGLLLCIKTCRIGQQAL